MHLTPKSMSGEGTAGSGFQWTSSLTCHHLRFSTRRCLCQPPLLVCVTSPVVLLPDQKVTSLSTICVISRVSHPDQRRQKCPAHCHVPDYASVSPTLPLERLYIWPTFPLHPPFPACSSLSSLRVSCCLLSVHVH